MRAWDVGGVEYVDDVAGEVAEAQLVIDMTRPPVSTEVETQHGEPRDQCRCDRIPARSVRAHPVDQHDRRTGAFDLVEESRGVNAF
jgi:hypothetical protein